MGEIIKQIVAETLNTDVDAITDDFDLSSCEEWDSLAQVIVLQRLEEELGVTVSYDDLIGLSTLSDLVKLANA